MFIYLAEQVVMNTATGAVDDELTSDAAVENKASDTLS